MHRGKVPITHIARLNGFRVEVRHLPVDTDAFFSGPSRAPGWREDKTAGHFNGSFKKTITNLRYGNKDGLVAGKAIS
ncbi:MAG: hypothetical protein IPK63_08415 [Candidatus Competibacteraceae bacterium]|nr:hypothetical protein [Candidatus Competibacteraceae bacterium]